MNNHFSPNKSHNHKNLSLSPFKKNLSLKKKTDVDHKTTILETEVRTRKNVEHLLKKGGCLDDPSGEGCETLEAVEQGS